VGPVFRSVQARHGARRLEGLRHRAW
jgi:hypothetical protein